MKRAAKAEEEAEEEGEDEPEVVHADVWQKRKGWLLRVPNDVAEKWHDRRRICEEYCALSKEAAQPKSRITEAQLRDKKAMAEQACVLGRLELGQAQTKRGNEGRGSFVPAESFATLPPKLEVEPEGAFCAMAPHLRILTEKHVFEEATGEVSKRLCVSAHVAGTYVVKPSLAAANKVLLATQKPRIVIEEFETDGNIRPMQQKEINAAQQEKHERRIQKAEARSEKGDTHEVKSQLLDLFTLAPFWRLSDLNKRTQQPENHLKMILEEICGEILKTGPNKGCYQLKDMYRTS